MMIGKIELTADSAAQHQKYLRIVKAVSVGVEIYHRPVNMMIYGQLGWFEITNSE